MHPSSFTHSDIVLPARRIPVAASRVFTFPTRLAAAWQPDILEYHLESYVLERPAIRLTTGFGKSREAVPGSNAPTAGRLRTLLGPSSTLQLPGCLLHDARYEHDGNIAHIVTNVAPKMMAGKAFGRPLRVILRRGASPVAREVFRLLDIPCVLTDEAVEGNLLASVEQCNGAYEARYTDLFGHLPFPGYHARTPERIFISRKGNRGLVNEREIERVLAARGFEKVYFEDIPVGEQWSYARNARMIVAIHGAALSSLVFNTRSVQVIELFHPGFVVNMYRHITNAVGGTWAAVIGQMPEDLIKELDGKQKARHFANAAVLIDPRSLEKALQFVETRATAARAAGAGVPALSP